MTANMSRHDTINKVVKGFAWEGSTKLVIQMVTWASTILVARLLTPEDYGIVAISGLFIGVLTIITDMGFMAALINQDEVSQEELDTTFWFSIFISFGLFLLVYSAAPLIADAYDSVILTDIIRVSAIMLPLTSLKIVPIAIAMRELNYRYRAITEMAGQFTMAMAAITLAYSGFGVWTLVYSVLLGQSIVVVAYLPLLKHVPVFSANYRKIRRIISYGSHLMLSQILEFFTLKADIFIISIFLSQKLVGYYSMGLQLSTMPLDKIGAVFNRVGFPAISRIKNNREESRKIFLYLHRYLVVITYPILIGFILITEDLVKLILTDNWLPIVPIIKVLCVINLLRVSGMIMPYVMAGLGCAGDVLKYQVLSSILLPVAFLVGVQFGLNGVLVGWFVAYPVLYGLIITMVSRRLDLQMYQYLSTFSSSVICSAIMYVAVYFVNSSVLEEATISSLVFSIAVGAVAYIGSFYLVFREEFLQIIKKARTMRK